MMSYRKFLESKQNHFFDAIFARPDVATLSAGADWLQDQDNKLGQEMAGVLAGRQAQDYAPALYEVRVMPNFVHVMEMVSVTRKKHYTYAHTKAPLVAVAETHYADGVLNYYGAVSHRRYGSDPMPHNPAHASDFENPTSLHIAGDGRHYQDLSAESFRLMVLAFCELDRHSTQYGHQRL